MHSEFAATHHPPDPLQASLGSSGCRGVWNAWLPHPPGKTTSRARA